MATAVTPSRADDPPAVTVTVTRTVTSTYRGHTARYYDAKFRAMRHLAYVRHKRVKQLKRTLLSRPSVSEAINLAAAVYGNGSWLWRVARCESGLNPGAVNSGSGSTGLFQFLRSTWATTPFASFSIYSAPASAMAAGWMASRGRTREWQCR